MTSTKNTPKTSDGTVYANILDRYTVQCPLCKTENKRDTWSIAHLDIEQVLLCKCGEVLTVLPEWEDR